MSPLWLLKNEYELQFIELLLFIRHSVMFFANTIFLIQTIILIKRYNYPYFAGEEKNSEGLNDLPKSILLLSAEITLRTGHFGFKAGGPFPQFATAQGSLECRDGLPNLWQCLKYLSYSALAYAKNFNSFLLHHNLSLGKGVCYCK